jgi:hypothetical protein
MRRSIWGGGRRRIRVIWGGGTLAELPAAPCAHSPVCRSEGFKQKRVEEEWKKKKTQKKVKEGERILEASRRVRGSSNHQRVLSLSLNTHLKLHHTFGGTQKIIIINIKRGHQSPANSRRARKSLRA